MPGRLRNKRRLLLRASGVQIRSDIGNESADVDVATTDGASVPFLSAQSSQPAHSLRPTALPRHPPPTARTHAPTAKAKIRSEPGECALLPPRRSPSQKRTSGCGLFLSNTSSSRRLSEIPDGEKNRYERPWCTYSKYSLQVVQDIECYGRSLHSVSGCQPRTEVFFKIKTFWCECRESVTYVTCDTVPSILAYVQIIIQRFDMPVCRPS